MSNASRNSPSNDDSSVDALIDEILHLCPEDEYAEDWLKRRHPTKWSQLIEPLRHAVAIRRAERLAEFSGNEEFFDIPLFPTEEEAEFLKHQLKGYSIKHQLGRGGQALVYEAIQESTGRSVAVKFLREGPLASPSQQQRFKREISLVTRLRHNNIVQVFDSGTVVGHNWFSMECVRGALCLDDYVLLKQLDVRAVVALCSQIARALGYAHQNGVIHRDIKPSNILVDDEGVPRVVDFGLAKDEMDADEAGAAAAEGHILGTLPYLSPEQAAGRGGQVDVRSDIYSLGLVIYQLIGGRWPYDVTGTTDQVRRRITDDAPCALSEARRSAPADACLPRGSVNEDLDRIILKALAKDKQQRYQSAIQLADDLDRYLNGEAIHARSEETWYNLRKQAHRYRTQLVVAAGFIILLTGSLVTAISLWQRAESAARLAQQKLDSVAFFRLGSVARDESRIDAAISLFQSAIDIASQSDEPDSGLMLVRFDSCGILARIYYERSGDDRSDFDRAERFMGSARTILEAAMRRFPNDDAWIARRASFQSLKGLREKTRKNFEGAIQHLSLSLTDLDHLITTYPDDTTLLTNRYYTLDELCQCQAEVGCFDEAIRLEEAKSKLAESRWEATHEPEHRLNMIMCQADMATYYCRRARLSTQDHDIALILVRAAKRQIAELQAGSVGGLTRNLNQNGQYYDSMEVWIEKRMMVLLNWHFGIPFIKGTDPFNYPEYLLQQASNDSRGE